MARLEDLGPGAAVKGVLPDGLVTVVDVRWHGSNVAELTYKDAAGRLGSELLYRYREPTLEVVTTGRPWSFDGDGALLRLVSEAYRIHLAYHLRSYPGGPHVAGRSLAAPDHRRLRRHAAAPAVALPAWPTTPAPARRSWRDC